MALSKTQEKEIVKKIHSFIGEGESHCLDKHSRIIENQRYERGEQWREGDMLKQAMRERPAIPYNSIIKVINAIANREIIERFEPRVWGYGTSDNGIANALDNACRWQRDRAESEHEESLAVRSMVGSGYGVMHKFFDPNAANGDGKICDEEIPVWDMLWPARARKGNLVDRRWHVRGRIATASSVEAEFQGKKSKNFMSKFRVKKSMGIPDTTLRNTGSFVGMGWGIVSKGNWTNLAEEEIFLAEAEWISPQVVWKVAVPDKFTELDEFLNGMSDVLIIESENPEEPMQLTKEQWDQIDPMDQKQLIMQVLDPSHIETVEKKSTLDEFLERYEKITQEEFVHYRRIIRDIVEYAIITDDNVWDSGIRPYGFTYEFLTGWRTENQNGADFFGVIDVAKGPQDFKNAILSNMLTQYMTSPRGHMLIEEGAMSNPGVFTDQIARPVGVGIVPNGFISGRGTTWDVLEPPRFPDISTSLLSIAHEGVEELFGLSSIDLGTQGDLRRVSGNVVQAARTAGNTIVAALFDAIRRYRKRFGYLNVRFITEFYSPQEIVRIVGDDKAPDLQNLTEWGDILRYDIKVEESPTSPSERMDLLERLQQVGSLDSWLEKGYINFEEMLDLIPHIPESFKRSIKARQNMQAQFRTEIDTRDNQIAQLSATLDALMQYAQSQGGGEIIQNFETQLQLAEPLAQQLAQAGAGEESALQGEAATG